MINVLLVDDHNIFRTGIRGILENTDGIQVIGEAGSGEEALRSIQKEEPDVVLMDVGMPGMGGLGATQKINRAYPGVSIIVLTAHGNAPFPKRLLDAGATGYLSKGCAADELTMAIRKAERGEKYIGSDIAQMLALSMLPGGESCPFDELSNREMEVMMMLVQGEAAQQIADKLALSPKTVSTYRYRVYDKLGVKNDVELTHLAIRHGILETDGTL